MRSARTIVSAALFAAAISGATSTHAAVTISTDATKNENCSGGVCTPTDKSANLNVSDLQTMLAASDVAVKTGAGAVAIGVASPLTWTSTHRLTLDSVQFVHIKAAVVVEGTGALTLTTNDGGTGGDLVFENGGTINFWDLGSSLVINGASYTLVGDIRTLASDIAANPSGNYALAASYDATPDGIYRSMVIATGFNGVFEGLGNTVSNLGLRSTFFTLVNGTVRDLSLANVSLVGKRGDRSGLARENDGLIANVFVDVSGVGKAGLVSTNNATIENCHAAIALKGATRSSVGGLVMENKGTIELSSASGAITLPDEGRAGGLVAINLGTVTRSFAVVDVSGSPGVLALGGLVGDSLHGAVNNSYATGGVSAPGRTFMGGLGGYGMNSTASYSTGAVAEPHKQRTGGLVGVAGNAISSYWDLDASGQTKSSGGIGLSDAQLKSALPAGFDPAIWGQDPNLNNGWPYLLANPPQ